jgi:hypothetical protein
MNRRTSSSIAVIVLLLFTVGVLAQRRGGGGGRRVVPNDMGPESRKGVPEWETDPHFKSEYFTFVRIRYTSNRSGGRGFGGGFGGGGGGGGGWSTDYPDSDLNFPFRLQQVTALKVNPTPIILDLTDEKLFDYPFIYMLEVGGLEFDEAEVAALRRYLLNGGFLMVDDFWGVAAYENFYEQIKRVFPDREPQELPLEHPIFHCVFDLKEKPQIPSVNVAMAYRGTNITWEREDAKVPEYKAIFDDKGRIMALICHNTDLGDGWEEEGTDPYYFREFSEKKAYPLGINIVFYAMTH